MKKLFVLCALFSVLCAPVARADDFGVQDAWDNPEANMSAGSIKPGFAQLTWSPGVVLPIKLRNGMVTMVNLPPGEAIEDGMVGNDGLFDFSPTRGGGTFFLTPTPTNQGSDTNLIITGKSGNKYLFYLRSEPSNSSEITYSQVDVVLEGRGNLPNAGGNGGGQTTNGMNSIFKKASSNNSVMGVDGEDYGWIKTMKIDPSEFRFDLDIFVPNPDDFVIAPERVWRDRIFTYIDFGDKVIAMTQRPVVSILVEGGESPVGFRTDGENGRLLIVEAVGDMVLRSGQRIVCIKKRAKPFLIADTASVMALAEANVMRSINSSQSLNNVGYGGMPMNAGQMQMIDYDMQPGGFDQGFQPPMMMQVPMQYGAPPSGGGAGTRGVNMLPAERNTAGAFLPQPDIPIISSNQVGVAVELKSDTSVKALNDYWTKLLNKFSGDEGQGLLTPYRNMVFFAVDERGVGDLGQNASSARLYRLRIGPMQDIDSAQKLCDQLTKFQGTSCHVVRVQ
ncbi:MAG: TrbG/VirB9 family P-type conjugative transfer protein [Alphaproteobacteria bacterium]|nr:TrbG/VirB9 family P-type conjugative transfer protein [Alphaproteobacteria bacterium]